ncbi:hypothetical protein RCO48_29790 [Peribacillus frigoritolerans]|nr:hypothetical protein [Peribacillus frigoritolerans]
MRWEKNVQAQLKSISETIRDPSLDIESGTGFEVESGDDVITSILLKDEKSTRPLNFVHEKR